MVYAIARRFCSSQSMDSLGRHAVLCGHPLVSVHLLHVPGDRVQRLRVTLHGSLDVSLCGVPLENRCSFGFAQPLEFSRIFRALPNRPGPRPRGNQRCGSFSQFCLDLVQAIELGLLGPDCIVDREQVDVLAICCSDGKLWCIARRVRRFYSRRPDLSSCLFQTSVVCSFPLRCGTEFLIESCSISIGSAIATMLGSFSVRLLRSSSSAIACSISLMIHRASLSSSCTAQIGSRSSLTLRHECVEGPLFVLQLPMKSVELLAHHAISLDRAPKPSSN